MPSSALARVLPDSDRYRGPGLTALLWSVAELAACLLVFVFIHLAIAVGLSPSERLEQLEGLLLFWGPVWQLMKSLPGMNEPTTALPILILLSGLSVLLRGYFLAQADRAAIRQAIQVADRIRMAIHRQVLRLGPGDVSGDSISYAVTLLTDEVDGIRQASLANSRSLRWGLELCLALLLLFTLDPLLAPQTIIPIAACWYFGQRRYQQQAEQRRGDQVQAQDKLKLLLEDLNLARLVRSYHVEDAARAKFELHLRQLGSKQVLDRSWGLIEIIGLVIVTCGVFYLILSKTLLEPSNLPPMVSVSFSALLGLMIIPFHRIVNSRLGYDRAQEAAVRISTFLDRIPEVGQAVGARLLQPLSKEIQFDQVSYSSKSGKPLLNQVSLTIRAGESIAIASIDPMEARTLAYLLPRFLEPQLGKVLIDGHDLAWVTLESLRAETIYVSAQDRLLSGTIAENLNLGREFHPHDLTEAAKTCHAYHFIMKLPDGFETQVGQRGETLTPGQIFRISLTRALLRKPALMIIEEPEERLDEDEKAHLDDAYQRILPGRTLIFLPARLGTVKRAHRVVMLHEGRVCGMGTHSELIERSPEYLHWEYSRFNPYR